MALALGRKVLDLLFPRFCLGCQVPMPLHEEGFFCSRCKKTFVFSEGGCCQYCGRPLLPTEEAALTCSNCLEIQPVFQNGVTLLAHKQLGRELVHWIKYRNGLFLKKDVEKLLLSAVDRLKHFQSATFIPVPLHFFRRWKRGFNQSAWLTQIVANVCQGQVENCLVRKRATPSQTHLSREERLANVKNAFAMKPGVTVDPQRQYVIVDDVMTTGSTLNACARVLQKQGAQYIGVFTLSHG